MAKKRKRLTEEQKFELAVKISDGVNFKDLCKEYDTNKTTLHRIKKQFVDKGLVNIAPRKVISKNTMGIAEEIIRNAKKSEILFNNGTLDHNQVTIYATAKLIKVIESMDAESENTTQSLKLIIDLLQNGKSEEFTALSDKGQVDFLAIIRETMWKVKNQFARSNLVIASTKELRGYLSENNKINLEISEIEKARETLNIFFQSLNILSQEDYEKIRDYIIEREPLARHLFNKWEETEDED